MRPGVLFYSKNMAWKMYNFRTRDEFWNTICNNTTPVKLKTGYKVFRPGWEQIKYKIPKRIALLDEFLSTGEFTPSLQYWLWLKPKKYRFQLFSIIVNLWIGKWIEWNDIAFNKIRYGENFWNCLLPRNVVQPGMKITFENDGVTGNFNKAEVGGATEVLLHTIELG